MISKEKLLSCLDVTLLKEPVTEADVIRLCDKIQNNNAQVASLCLPARFVHLVRSRLGNSTAFCTVINFPTGSESFAEVKQQLKYAIDLHVDEVDYVMDYKAFLAGSLDQQQLTAQIKTIKALCPPSTILKVIMETGELIDASVIQQATAAVAAAGADFAKTSTGMTPQGASLEALTAIIAGINTYKEKIARHDFLLGIKISGGVKSIQQATVYVNEAAKAFGWSFIHPRTFRIGASQLFDEILET